MLAGGDRHRRARRPGRRAADLRALRPRGRSLLEGLAGVDLPVLRRRLPGEDAARSRCTAGCPTATGRCRSRCSRCSRRSSRRSPPTASCAIVLPLFPDAAVHFQTLMLLIALASILYGSVMAFTQTDARLIVGYSSVAQLGFITLGIFSLRPAGRAGRAAADGQPRRSWSRRCSSSSALLAARAGGSEDIRDMGGIAFRAPVLAALFLIVALANARDARLVELRRRVPDPARRLQGQAGDRHRRVHRRGAGQRLHAAGVHPRDAQPRRARRSSRARSRLRDGLCSCRSCS